MEAYYSNQKLRKKSEGFTIVELLIVIVVIAILAAITIVAFRGIQDRARVSAAKSAVSQGVKKVMAYAALNSEQYPTTLTQADIVSGNGTTYEISANNSVSPKQYCVTATTQATTYFQTNTMQDSLPGTCIGMLAWWPFNGDANDKSGNGVDGTVNGATLTAGTTGQTNTAYQLGETSQWINVGTPPSFSVLPSSLTYSIWLARTGTSTSQWPMVMGATDTHRDFGIRTNNFGAGPYFEWGVSPFDGASWTSTGAGLSSLTNLNEWHHTVVTFDGSVARSYWDGSLRSTSGATTLRPTMSNFSFTVNGGSGWQGKIDDARVYSRALSAAEIANMYNAGAQ